MQLTNNKIYNNTCTLHMYSIVIKTTAETKEYLTQASSTKEALSKALDYFEDNPASEAFGISVEVKQKHMIAWI